MDRVLFWTVAVLLAAALPLVVLAALLPINEYEAIGLGGIDCDGPAGVLVLGLFVFLVHGAALAYAVFARRSGAAGRRYSIMAAYCFVILVLVTPNLSRAARADAPPECGRTN